LICCDWLSFTLSYFLSHHQSTSVIYSPSLHDALPIYFDVSPIETSQLVGTLGDIEGICAWAIFVQEENSIRVRIRSKGPALNKIAEKYNGGGHPLASGATIYHW